jgi:hypothetical protein
MSKKNIATVILTVTDFNEVPPPNSQAPFKYTSCNVTLCPGSTKRVIPTPAKQGLPPDPNSLTVCVKESHKPVHFHIKIAGNNTKEIYHPVGIAFRQSPCVGSRAKFKKLKSSSVHGNFPEDSVEIVNDVLYFTDTCRDDCDSSSFDYYVFIQQEGADKVERLGIIDPGLSHDNTIGIPP